MEDLVQRAHDLQREVKTALERLRFSELLHERQKLNEQMAKPDFWTDPTKAQEVSKRHAALQRRMQPWEKLKSEIDDILELAELHDGTLQTDLTKQIAAAQNQFDELKGELKYSGPYDDHSVILSIYA